MTRFTALTGDHIKCTTNHNNNIQIAAQFNDATEDEIKLASEEKDVCCICLSEMNNKLGQGVKKLKQCSHLLHTKCICDVVEKARSVDTALCPLCRVSIGCWWWLHCHVSYQRHLHSNHSTRSMLTIIYLYHLSRFPCLVLMQLVNLGE